MSLSLGLDHKLRRLDILYIVFNKTMCLLLGGFTEVVLHFLLLASVFAMYPHDRA